MIEEGARTDRVKSSNAEDEPSDAEENIEETLDTDRAARNRANGSEWLIKYSAATRLNF